ALHLGSQGKDPGAAPPLQMEAGLDDRGVLLPGGCQLCRAGLRHAGRLLRRGLPDRVRGRAARPPRREEGDPALGRTALAPEQEDEALPRIAAALARGRAPARVRPRTQPVEKLWANLKGTELANLCAETLDEPIRAARRGVERVRSDEDLLFGFLEATGLSLCFSASTRST